METYPTILTFRSVKEIIVHRLQLCSDRLESPARSLIGRRAIIVRFQHCSKVLVATEFKGDRVVARRLLTQDTDFNQLRTEQQYALTVDKTVRRIHRMLHSFFRVIPRLLNFIFRRFGTICLFHLYEEEIKSWDDSAVTFNCTSWSCKQSKSIALQTCFLTDIRHKERSF
jgi:hypothetical protein